MTTSIPRVTTTEKIFSTLCISLQKANYPKDNYRLRQIQMLNFTQHP